ncbi:hypothetical protein IC235_11245 [Hymenobacter sp. BT664]|uniref:Uncharacterized protein n=1 Tax=Hymenobacter montanus TaxID=2771359 RepID=A0A927BDU4_9BACT|nr:Imm44 family immunity protein [Hymenobacter montanus]MBD2768465.1 hypothetical protein [Hymenobacter montanus]
MILWISGIVEAEVGDAFFETMKIVQSGLNTITKETDFGNAIEKIRVVFIINRDPTPEYRRFGKKDKTLDARARINYIEFRDSSKMHRIRMFIETIAEVIGKTNNFSNEEFDKQSLLVRLQSVVLQSS